MLYIERREKILEMLRKSGNVKVSDLVDIFHVDATTIRRDLKALADNCLLYTSDAADEL